MSTTGLVHHPACIGHDPGPGHPERPDRLRSVLRRLEASGLGDDMEVVRGREATDAEAMAAASEAAGLASETFTSPVGTFGARVLPPAGDGS